MELYNKIYKYISRVMFAVHSAYVAFTVVCLFLPLWNGSDTTLITYYWGGWHAVIPFVSLGILCWGAWCTFKCPESPLLSLGTGVFTFASYVILMILPALDVALTSMFAPDASTKMSSGWVIFGETLNILSVVYFIFLAYSIVTFILGTIKPIKKD